MFTQQADSRIRRPCKKKRRKKLVLIFDEDRRREFLTGFHKRKVQRKKKAKEELEKQLKAERKRIKAESKEEYKKLLLAQKPIPELEDLLSEEIDLGTHSVTVTELSAADLARKNNWIGANEVQYSEKEAKDIICESDEEMQNSHELEGMELTKKNKKKSVKEKIVVDCKDIKKKIKKQATRSVQKSKVFQKKAQMEKIRSKKLKKKQEKLEKFKKKSKKDKYKRN